MNILIFGPNGSGKGTQGSAIQKEFGFPQIESGLIFREHIVSGTPLGEEAKRFTRRGDLVPDEVTVPMVLERLSQNDCENGWLLDGFPRSKPQAVALHKFLSEKNTNIDFVVEITLDKQLAKDRLLGRRTCKTNNNNHPNHLAYDAIKPNIVDGVAVCRVCGGGLKVRKDDQDEAAIDKRLNIYYNKEEGTLPAIDFFRELGRTKVVSVDGSPAIAEVTKKIMSGLRGA